MAVLSPIQLTFPHFETPLPSHCLIEDFLESKIRREYLKPPSKEQCSLHILDIESEKNQFLPDFHSKE